MKINREVIKYIAIVLMIIDHIIQVFSPRGTLSFQILDSLSHFTFITLSYFLVEGYYYTKSKKEYLKRILIFAMISQFPYHLAFSGNNLLQFVSLNIFFTLAFSFTMIWIIDNTTIFYKKILVLLLTIVICAFCDWSIFGPIITYAFYLSHGSKKKSLYAYLFILLTFGTVNSLGYFFVPGTWITKFENYIINSSGIFLSAICILLLYDGTKMKSFKNFNKWFFYVIYPVHLLIIGIIHYYY